MLIGAAVSSLIAAKSTWIACEQARSFTELLDEAVGAVRQT